MKELFDDLLESMEQMGEIVRGERAPSCVSIVDGDESRRVCHDFGKNVESPIMDAVRDTVTGLHRLGLINKRKKDVGEVFDTQD